MGRSAAPRGAQAWAIVMLGLCATACVACARPAPLPEARAGRLDLTAWHPARDGPVRLDGDWAFYWKRLIDPGSPLLRAEPPGWARVPNSWNALERDGAPLPGHGFATYRLQVRLPPDHPELAIKLRDMGTAYRLYANGGLVASAGTVGTDAASSRPQYRARVAELPDDVRGALDLVLQVSNFHYSKGGAWELLWLGSQPDIRRLRESALMFQAFIAGTMVIMGLYHLSLFALRRRDPSPLYFGGMCLAMVLRVFSTDERALVDLFPRLPWEWVVRIEYQSMFLGVAFLAWFALALFPRDVPAGAFRAIAGISGIGLLFVLLSSADTYSRLLPAIQVFLGATSIFGAALIIRAAWRRREGALTFAVAFVLLAASVLHDIAVSTRWLATPAFLVPVGIFWFAFLQAAVLSRRFSRSLLKIEEVSDDLYRAHANLEARVAERTEQLERASQELARIASVDGLTRIGNRRLFDESLQRLWSDHLRRGARLAVVMCDVDHFKKFNDAYGHLQGDDALKAVAGVFRELVRRPLDVVARYGGEELVVVLADTTAEGARHVAEQLRVAVEAVGIPHEASDCGDVLTISLGVADAVPRPDQEPTQLVSRADRALYRAKQAGRNRVVVDTAEPTDGR